MIAFNAFVDSLSETDFAQLIVAIRHRTDLLVEHEAAMAPPLDKAEVALVRSSKRIEAIRQYRLRTAQPGDRPTISLRACKLLIDRVVTK